MRKTRWTTALIAALAIAACGGDGGPSGPSGPDIKGTYTGSHSIAFSQGGEAPTIVGCPGRVVINQSSGRNFSGSMRINRCIAAMVSTDIEVPMSGTIEEDGSTRFTVALLAEALLAVLEQQEGCDAQIEDAFTGSVLGDTFTSEIQADVACEGQEDVHVVVSFEGTRVP